MKNILVMRNSLDDRKTAHKEKKLKPLFMCQFVCQGNDFREYSFLTGRDNVSSLDDYLFKCCIFLQLKLFEMRSK